MTHAIIRPFQNSDVSVAAAIAEKAMDYPWSETVFRDCFKAGYHAWMLELDEPIGFLIVLDNMNECEILNIGVLPEYQRKGYGQQLLAHAMAYAESEHLSRLTLEVRASNQAAISLYHAVGFIDVGIRKNYYSMNAGREDAVLMSLGRLTCE